MPNEQCTNAMFLITHYVAKRRANTIDGNNISTKKNLFES